MDRVHVAIIGCGSIAQRKILPALLRREDVDVCAFYDNNPRNSQSACAQFGNARSYVADTLTQVLNDSRIDAVYVCTPNSTHSELTIAALNHNKHVMCEKPMALSYGEAVNMLNAAEKAGKVLSIGFQNRFRDDYMMVKSLGDEGFFGDMYYVKAYTVRRMGIPNWGAFLNKDIQGGGPLIDLGSHVLDLALWLTNNYKPAYVVGAAYNHIGRLGSDCNRWGPWPNEEYDIEDSAFGFVRMENGMTISIETAWAMHTTDERTACVSLYGSKAGAEMRNGLTIVREMNGSLVEIKPSVAAESSQALAPGNNVNSANDREVASFIEAVKAQDPSLGNARQAAVVTKITEALYHSAQIGRPVDL